jgi:hypothetical protein
MSRTLQERLTQVHRQVQALEFKRNPCDECGALVASKSPIICAGARCADGWHIFAICKRCKRSGLLPHIRAMVAAGGDAARWVSTEFAASIPGGLIDITDAPPPPREKSELRKMANKAGLDPTVKQDGDAVVNAFLVGLTEWVRQQGRGKR